ncbi:methionine biosynthesis protein MetW [bacterium]|nr:methionine biosynthesis protein MetW [bacterium]
MRLDLKIIADLIQPHSRILDLGCGQGELLAKLMENKQCRGQGIEIDDQNICACVEKGVPVIHADLDEGLHDYPDRSFDYVILSRTLQVVKRPDFILKEMLRVGKIGVVSFPNFSALSVRAQLFFKGRMPVTRNLPYEWFGTPNIHLLTIKDFKMFCKNEKMRIRKQINLGSERRQGVLPDFMPNLFAHLAIFKIEMKHDENE